MDCGGAMQLSGKLVRRQLERMKPTLDATSLDEARKGQDLIGGILAKTVRKEIKTKQVSLPNAKAVFITPIDKIRQGVIFYLHGGGYTCGDIEYAKGFGSILAVECGISVFCIEYSLAPEKPFPAALNDAVNGYRYLLSHGYLPSHIALCGESAGGGLCYCLVQKLSALNMPLPACIAAISPWTDLTQSGKTHETNRENDPSLTTSKLDFYASCYADDPRDPLVSPLFADLKGMPPSLIFVGGDEILLDDSLRLHKKLLAASCRSEIVIADKMWHAYMLYCIKERAGDFDRLNAFLNKYLTGERKLRWMRLDNAAKIFPAAKRRKWNNFFRLSAELTENVNTAVLKKALDITVRRFPSIAVRLCRGLFWYYLEELSEPPEISQEQSWPLAHEAFEKINECALRVIVYKKRIAVEFYHAITDGTGGLVFLKTLLAEYLEQKYAVTVPNEKGVLDRLEIPPEEEFEDSFFKYHGIVSESRRNSAAYKERCTYEKDDFRHITTFMLKAGQALAEAKKYNVSLTVFLTSCMLLALQRLQNEQISEKRKQKPVRVIVPVNLRNLFPSRTLRNFAHVVMPEIDPRRGDYSVEEIINSVYHQLGEQITAKSMSAKFTPNVNAEKGWAVRAMPLFAKNLVMKAVYNTVGEKTSCLNLSNLGVVDIPEIMKKYITRFDFILSVQATRPRNCGLLTYNGIIYMNFIRNTVEPALESRFYEVLREHGIHVKVESNQRRD